MLWETHLHHRAQTLGSDSPARSSGLGGRAGSHPGSGSADLGCSSPEGKGTGWRAWCLRCKVQGMELSLLELRWAQAGPGCLQPAAPGGLCKVSPGKTLASAIGVPTSPIAYTGLPSL